MQSHEPKNALTTRQQELGYGQECKDAGDFETAYEIAYKWLKLNPEDPAALCLLAAVMIDTDKVAVAHPIARQLTQIAPDAAVSWLNYGRCAADLWRYSEAERAYKKALKIALDDKTKSSVCVNMASMMVDHGRFREAAKYCRDAIVYNPDTTKGKANLGFCQLAGRDWAEGWKNYRQCIGANGRYYTQYNDEPLWDGESKGTICIYGEQGLGDEVSFSQMLPDMQKWCDQNESRLIVDVQPRLLSLFRRSFPDIEIYGDRSTGVTRWDASQVDYSLPIAQLGEYFRCKDEQFTGKPYLKADPDRVLQWKALFESKGKPVIGIGYMSGIWKTAAKFRQMDLEQMLPIFRSIDAHWVSLQYKPAGKQIQEFKRKHPDIDIVEYPHGTLSNDFDDTVSMIEAMDMVIALQTTAIHVAGALGVPTWVLVPKTSQWRYGEEGTDFPWAESVKIWRQTKPFYWDDVVQEMADDLPKRFEENKSRVKKKRVLEQPTLKTNGSRQVLGESRPSG